MVGHTADVHWIPSAAATHPTIDPDSLLETVSTSCLLLDQMSVRSQ